MATTDWINEGLNHPRTDKIVQFARGNLLIRVGQNDYAAKVVVATETDGKMKLYDILDLNKTQIMAKEMDVAITENPSPDTGRNTTSISDDNVSQRQPEVNRKSSLRGTRYSVDDERFGQGVQKSPTEPKKRGQPVAESRPIRAKRELRQTLMGLFSIPEGSRVELWEMIDSYADRLIKNGGITEEDRRTFFDRMYEAGVMVAPADDYFAEGRNYIEGGKIYVPDSVVAEFGDDWADIRRRAFCAGVYLTRSDMSKGHRVSGMKGWEKAKELLSWDLPGIAKRAIFGNKISDTREDAIGTLMKEGISFDRFLSAYSIPQGRGGGRVRRGA